jgi:hypothetical protein
MCGVGLIAALGWVRIGGRGVQVGLWWGWVGGVGECGGLGLVSGERRVGRCEVCRWDE